MNKLWRIGNHLSKMGWVPRKISRILELINHLICACSVSIDAEIGNRTIFYHRGIGCVVHPKAVIGEDCKIFQGVTIGSKWSKASCLGEAPRIGNNVMIGAGAGFILSPHLPLGRSVGMPYRPSVPCKHPGCPALVPYGSGPYCDRHKALH